MWSRSMYVAATHRLRKIQSGMTRHGASRNQRNVIRKSIAVSSSTKKYLGEIAPRQFAQRPRRTSQLTSGIL